MQANRYADVRSKKTTQIRSGSGKAWESILICLKPFLCFFPKTRPVVKVFRVFDMLKASVFPSYINSYRFRLFRVSSSCDNWKATIAAQGHQCHAHRMHSSLKSWICSAVCTSSWPAQWSSRSCLKTSGPGAQMVEGKLDDQTVPVFWSRDFEHCQTICQTICQPVLSHHPIIHIEISESFPDVCSIPGGFAPVSKWTMAGTQEVC